MLGKKFYFFGIFLAMFCCFAPFLKGEGPLPENASRINPDPGTSVEVGSAVQMAQEEIRDPFGSPLDQNVPMDMTSATVEAPVVSVDLQGIGFGSKEAYAVIGGEVYSVGDEKGGIKLLEVRRHEVDILVNGGVATFSLFPGSDLKNITERELRKRGAMAPSNQPIEREKLSPRREQPLS